MENETSTQTNDCQRTNGRVKWFNNKAGYGFLTVGSGDDSGTDVFVHHTAIQVEKEQFKYLVEGEYVEFVSSAASDSSKHKFQASDVRGVNGGKLMCETRNQSRAPHVQGADNAGTGGHTRTAGSHRGLVRVAEDLVSEQSLILTTGMSNGCWFVGSVLTTETVMIEVETREGTQILPALPMTTNY